MNFFIGKNGRKGDGRGAAGASAVLSMNAIRKVYDTGAVKVEALRGVDLTVQPSEFVSIVGPSGSGKSTLLNIIGCLDVPSGGSYLLDGEEVAELGIDELADIRNRKIGFVFQSFNLLPQITAYENVEMPLLFKGTGARERRERVEWLFEQVGLADRMHHRPVELSGGQMQRVAIARALACDPALILADEPTGNLDTGAGRDILSLFEQLAEQGRTLVLITHDNALARRTRRIVRVQDGRIVEDEPVTAVA
ncbi:MAG: ABC transporter ATP-binding protein [Thermoanaerobaculia bacterium]|nr:MAG: ABC transporter ATP-binding protein [Thermoanaerobaculia bacterium]MBZ0101732.1 ABC transporter ATP-binding protein [Thermoanaerobaculia bacterium]